MNGDRSDRRRGDYEILDRLSAIEKKQSERWEVIRQIYDRLAVIETRQVERWDVVQGEFRRIESRLVNVEQLIKGRVAGITGGSISAVMQDLRVLLVGALVAGMLLGKAGINPLDWLGLVG